MSSPVLLKIDFEDFQECFINGDITLDQFIDVLNDNFGHIKTRAIMKKNLKLARKLEGAERRAKLLNSYHQE